MPTKKEKIEQLFEITGALTSIQAKTKEVITSFTEGFEKMTGESFSTVRDSINAVLDRRWPEYATQVVSYYEQELTDEEVDAVLNFHLSDIGKTYVLKSRLLSYRSEEAAEKWFKSLEDEILNDLSSNLIPKEDLDAIVSDIKA